jgi:hypothetical protein
METQSQRWYRQNRTLALQRAAKRYRENKYITIANRLLITARHRAKKFGLPFDLSLDDLKIPSKCPILGHKFELGNGKAGVWSPTIDRIIPELGYIKGNIQIISLKANSIKGISSLFDLKKREQDWSFSLSELRKVIRYLEKINT